MTLALKPTSKRVVQQAAAFRTKYVVRRCRLHSGMVGPHPKNRDGIGVNGSRCDDLLGDFLRVGYDASEADHDAICVEEKAGSKEILQFNIEMCCSDELLADVKETSMPYGSLAHSHVNQVMRNCIGGAKSSHKVLTNASPDSQEDLGVICMELVERVLPGFHEACASGLYWEVLSHAMLEEECDAADIIQAACNVKGGIAMMEHEMQAISRLARICSAEMKLAQKVAAETVQKHIQPTMPDLAASADFAGVLSFVLDLGADDTQFIAGLRAFHANYVNAKKRRLRWSVFAAAADLDDYLPFCKVALVKYAYGIAAAERADPTDPFIDVLRSTDVRKLRKALEKPEDHPEGNLRLAENILKFFHTACANVCASGRSTEKNGRVAFLAKLDIGIARCLLVKTSAMPQGLEHCIRIAEVADAMHKEFCAKNGECKLPPLPWTPTTGARGAASAAGDTAATLAPVVLQFDRSGNVLTHQTQLTDNVVQPEILP